MEELQDAIEDAQYVTAIAAQEDGPRPVLAWDVPNSEQLMAWEQKKKSVEPNSFSPEWVLHSPIGFFLFSTFLKTRIPVDTTPPPNDSKGPVSTEAIAPKGDYLRINFCEDVARFKALHGRQRLDFGRKIVRQYVSGTRNEDGTWPEPPRTEIDEYDLYREHTSDNLDDEQLKALFSMSMDYPECSECSLGLRGSVRTDVIEALAELEEAESARGEDSLPSLRENEEDLANEGFEKSSLEALESSMRDLTERLRFNKMIGRHMFDRAEALVVESLKQEFWKQFQLSPEYKKLKNFLWYQDRPVVPEDFFVMRVLGRGGFGLVHGMFT